MKIKKRTLKRILFAVMLVFALVNCFSIICGTTVFAGDLKTIDDFESDNDSISDGIAGLLNRNSGNNYLCF